MMEEFAYERKLLQDILLDSRDAIGEEERANAGCDAEKAGHVCAVFSVSHASIVEEGTVEVGRTILCHWSG